MFGKKKVDKELKKVGKALANANSERLEDKEKREKEKEKLKVICKSYRVSKSFVIVLALVSILGFVGIITKTLGDVSIDPIIEALWFFIMGIGFIAESKPLRLFKRIHDSLDQKNFTSMTTLIIGLMGLTAGFLKLASIENLVFSAIQGFISIIAIIFIIVETWVVKE